MHGSENTAQQYGGECALLNKEWTLPLSTLSSDFDVLPNPLMYHWNVSIIHFFMKGNSNTKVIKYLEDGFHRNSCWWTNIKILRVSCLPFAIHWITVVAFAWWARPGLILPCYSWNRIWSSDVAGDTEFIFTSNHNNLLWFVDDGCHWEKGKITAVVILIVI